jgi:hypothetical protein
LDRRRGKQAQLKTVVTVVRGTDAQSNRFPDDFLETESQSRLFANRNTNPQMKISAGEMLFIKTQLLKNNGDGVAPPFLT